MEKSETSAESPGVSSVVCSKCSGNLSDFYYLVNGHTVCPGCQHVLQSADPGETKTILRAFGSGMMAATVCALLAGAITYLMFGTPTPYASPVTGSKWSFVVIAIGAFVGYAVSRGANGRGGWFIRLVAILLTYIAIGMTIAATVCVSLPNQQEFDSQMEQMDADALIRSKQNNYYDDRQLRKAAAGNQITTEMLATRNAVLDRYSTGTVLTVPQKDGTVKGYRIDQERRTPIAVSTSSTKIAAFIFFSLIGPPAFAIREPLCWLYYALALLLAAWMVRQTPIKISGPHKVSE